MLQQLGRVLRRRRPGRHDVAHRGALSVRPRLELLEDRLAPAVFNVNSTADILAPPPGVVTLRSAIQAANATPGNNIINLTVPGSYKITLVGTPGESDNLAGEFAIIPNAASPPNSTLLIQNTSGGAVTVDANHLNRVFDINPGNTNNPATKLLVTMQGFAITNGIVSPGDLAGGSGGGVRDQGNANLTLMGMLVSNNAATADGGGVSMENAPASTPWTLTIIGSTITNNRAGDAGGGVEEDGTGRVIITSSTLSNNTAVNQGAAVWLDAIGVGSASLTMTDTLVSGNTAVNGPTGAIGNSGNGAVTISSSTVRDNFSGTTGGGFGDENNLGTLTVNSSFFFNNTAVSNGGGIQEGGPSTQITSSQIERNTAGGNGGGVFADGTTLVIQSSTIDINSAAGNGGGIELETTGANSAIINTTLFGNSALNNAGGNGGGGIDAPAAFTGTVTLLNDTINGNFASSGGGIFWAGAGASKVIVQNTILAANAASTSGSDANNAAGNFTDAGGNLIGVSGAGSGNNGFSAATTQQGTTASPLNPLLAGLAYNGGPITGSAGNTQPLQTEMTLAGSPARDRGVATGLTVDERGFRRPDDAEVLPDVGAVEFQDVTLAVRITPSATNVPLGGTVSFQVQVTNTSGNDLPDDASTVAVTLSSGLTPTSALTFALGALPAGQSKTFSVSATATALGVQTAGVTVTSPDATPSTVSTSVTVTVTAVPAGVPPAAITPVGALTLYAFGFGPGFTLDFFEVDSVGHVFIQGFSFQGPVGPVQFLANSLRIPTGFAAVVNNTVAAFEAGDNGQLFLIDIGFVNPLAFFNPFVFNAVLVAFGL